MLQLTVIANTQLQVLHISFQEGPLGRIFAEFFTGNPSSKNVPFLQEATGTLKTRLSLFDLLGERAYKFKQFINQIPDNQHFLVLPGCVDDELQIYLWTKKLAEIDNSTLVTADLGLISSYLGNHYKVRTFKGDQRVRIGESDKLERVCRFCGRSMPGVSFKQKAHAISEALGNKGLICLEECDECNRHFNETIEQDIINFFHFQLLFHGVKGKNGNPTLKGEGLTVSYDSSSRERFGRDAIVFKVNDLPDTRDPQKIANYLSRQFSFPNEKYIPQNVYKCFCKFVLSLIDSQYIPYFKDTIKWINEPLTKRCLPPVWCCNMPMADTPFIIIMQRKHRQKFLPYCWAILNISGSQFLFILPFSSCDKYKFVGKNRVDYFWGIVNKIMPNIPWESICMKGILPREYIFDSHMTIAKECIEGEGYYWVDPITKTY